jgi:hypothetical protein
MRLLLLTAFLITAWFTVMPQTNDPKKKSPAELMSVMRLKQLTSVPSGEKPTPEFPRVCAVIMDWPIETATVTVVARATGDASVYTTATFGILGGIGHEKVRNAAKSCVRVAERHYGDATLTRDYPYPKAGRVRFYLVGYSEVRVIDADLETVSRGKDKCSDLYEAAQHVVTELRLMTQEQK